MFLEAVLNFCHKSDIDDDDDGLFAFDDSVAAATAATAATAAGAKVAAAAIADTSLSRNESFRDIELIDGHANSNVIFSYIGLCPLTHLRPVFVLRAGVIKYSMWWHVCQN